MSGVDDLSATATPIIICEPRKDCADANVNRWHCMRGYDGAPDGICPLAKCERERANRG